MLPSFTNELLFPMLSPTPHSLDLRKVYLPSNLDPVIKAFLENKCVVLSTMRKWQLLQRKNLLTNKAVAELKDHITIFDTILNIVSCTH
jgi:hypothetical protein